MARQVAPRLRRNRMFVNLEYILIEKLADVVFITADYLEEEYNNVPGLTATLQEDLQELRLDLFDIVETNPNFSGIFTVLRPPAPLSGFLRINKINQHTSTPTSNFDLSNSIGFSQKAAIEAPPGSSAILVEEVYEEQEGDSSASEHWVTEEHGEENGQDIAQTVDSNLNMNEHSAKPIISQVESETEGSIISEPISTPKKTQEVVQALVVARHAAASISSNSSSSVQHTPPLASRHLVASPGCYSLDRPPGFETTSNCSVPGFSSSAKPSCVMPPSVFSPQKRVEGTAGESVIKTPEERGPDQLFRFLNNVNPKTEENNQNVSKKPIQKPSDNSKKRNNDHFYESDFEEDFGDLPTPKPQNVPVVGSGISCLKPAEHSNHQQPVMYKVDGNGLITNYMEAFHTRQLFVNQIIQRIGDSNDDELPWDKMENIEQIVANLRRLHQLYPQGCTSLQLYKFDEALRLSNAESEECSSGHNYLSMAYLIENEMLQVWQGLFIVNPAVFSTSFVRLKRNFCSNLYRLLYRFGGQAKIQDILPELSLYHLDASLGAQDLLRLCNRYPLLFTLKASQNDKFSLNSSVISLNTSLPDWKILLDCENTVMEGSLCECLMCAF